MSIAGYPSDKVPVCNFVTPDPTKLADELEALAEFTYGFFPVSTTLRDAILDALRRPTPPPDVAMGSVAEEWDAYMTEAVNNAPEPLQKLGEYLANLLCEDEWKTAEQYLNAAALASQDAPSAPPSDDVERVARALFDFERRGKRLPGWDKELPEFREYQRNKARAAIAALQETKP